MDATFSFLLSIFLLLGVIGSNGEISPDGYWNEKLPKSPIPDSLRIFLPSEDQVAGVGRNLVIPDGCSAWHNYPRQATFEELNSPDVNFLFLRENLKTGTITKNLDFFKKDKNWPTFLPRREVERLPFSSSKLSDILRMFKINPTSRNASRIKETLEDCESKANEGEVRLCATSLESMIDFAVSQLKTNNVGLFTTPTVDEQGAQLRNRLYKIQPGIVELPSENAVVCHITSYPYAVFYCHESSTTKSFIIPLLAEEDGSRVNARAVCHMETSSWNPKQAMLLSLGVKAGTPVCHFLHHGHYVWLAN